jgi:hypothetical protein
LKEAVVKMGSGKENERKKKKLIRVLAEDFFTMGVKRGTRGKEPEEKFDGL